MNLSFLVVSWFLTFGYVPEMGVSVDKYGCNTVDFSSFTTVIDTGLSITAWDKISLYTSMENYQYFSPGDINKVQFWPFQIGYTVGVTYTPIENISFDLYHKCEHPVAPDSVIVFPYNYSQTRISVTIKGNQRL